MYIYMYIYIYICIHIYVYIFMNMYICDMIEFVKIRYLVIAHGRVHESDMIQFVTPEYSNHLSTVP